MSQTLPNQSEIVVVSGLPRSGTSLMMQILQRGGIPPLTDEVRAADTDNPRGYYEFEPVKTTAEDPSWLCDARGKAVKIVSSLLYQLPPTEVYRVIFMCRDLEEIIRSQEKMLQRLNRTAVPRAQIQAAFLIHLQRLFTWGAQQEQFRILKVNYNNMVDSPDAEISKVVAFLDGRLSATEMKLAIDPALYRNRKSSTDIVTNSSN